MTGSKQEFEKYFFFMIMAGAVILLANVYYYTHPLMERMGLTHDFSDALFIKLHQGGVFSHSAKTKLMALVLSLGAHWVDSRESSLLRRLERGREIGL